MKKAIFLAMALHCGAAAADTVDGTLHRASLRDWQRATTGKQLTTAADIVEKILNSNDHIALAPKAREVQACINRVSTNFALDSQLVFDTAIACMAKLGYLPRL